jgi:hypothetical protein
LGFTLTCKDDGERTYKLTDDPQLLLNPDSILLNMDSSGDYDGSHGPFNEAVEILRARVNQGLESYQDRVTTKWETVTVHDKPFLKQTVDALRTVAVESKRLVLTSKYQYLAQDLASIDPSFYVLTGKKAERFLSNGQSSRDLFVLRYDEHRPARLKRNAQKRKAKPPPPPKILLSIHILPLANALDHVFKQQTGLYVHLGATSMYSNANKAGTIENMCHAVQTLRKLGIKPRTLKDNIDAKLKTFWSYALSSSERESKTRPWRSLDALAEYVRKAKPRDDRDIAYKKLVAQLKRMCNVKKPHAAR